MSEKLSAAGKLMNGDVFTFTDDIIFTPLARRAASPGRYAIRCIQVRALSWPAPPATTQSFRRPSCSKMSSPCVCNSPAFGRLNR